MLPLLESIHNPKIKDVLSLLEKPKERQRRGLFVVEGIREVSLALKAGFFPQALYYLPQIIPNPNSLFQLPQAFRCQSVSKTVYQKIAYRDGTEGVVAVMRQKELLLSNVSLSPNPLILVMEGVEKPGNIGAILRSADAAQADAVLVCDPLCDLFNPNLIRSSLGAIFSSNVIICSSLEALHWLQKSRIDIYAATLQDSFLYTQPNYSMGCAFVVGAEAHGLSLVWRKAAKACIHIPMRGSVDSLNVSVSAAILMFEAARQRCFLLSNNLSSELTKPQ